MELDVPVLFHSGFAGAGIGMPGGGGMKLKYAAPIPHIDDIAADFPGLTVIMAHPAWPWVEEQIAVALHKPNVYIDLSGWAPRYIPQQLIHEANTRLQDKVLFGSDFPYLPPDRWLSGLRPTRIRDEVRPKILLETPGASSASDSAAIAIPLGSSKSPSLHGPQGLAKVPSPLTGEG